MNGPSRQILYVGESIATEPRLQADLRELNPAWGASFAGGAEEAFHAMAEAKFDAVVADDLLPDMDGFRFLDTVQLQHLGAHRFIVCDLAHPHAAERITRMPHQCVPKPWNSDTLHSVLERTFALNGWLSKPAVRALIQRLPILPSPPTFYFEIVRALQSNEVNLEDLATQAERDPALTAKLLQMANSAALGLSQTVTRVDEAISYLGLTTTRSLVLLAHTFAYCDKARAAGFSIERLWQRSLAVGALARKLAREEQITGEMVDECFLAGLLHDIGKLLLAANAGGQYSRVIEQVRQSVSAGRPQITLCQAEYEEFGATHAEIGAELMAMWNLPLGVVEALALHHRPEKLVSFGFCPLAAVHAADGLLWESSGRSEPLYHAEVDLTYLWDIGVAERLEVWRGVTRSEFERVELAELNE